MYRARGLYEQIKFKGEIGLLKDAYAIDRNSTEVREALLKSLLDYFRHASHEWPAVILWGMDGATLDQCNEIMSEVALARELDRGCAYALVPPLQKLLDALRSGRGFDSISLHGG